MRGHGFGIDGSQEVVIDNWILGPLLLPPLHEVQQDVRGDGALDLAVDVVPGLPRADMLGCLALGIGVTEVTQMLLLQCREQLELRGVITSSGEVKTANKGDQSPTSILSVGIFRVTDDSLLVVGVCSGGEDVLEVICHFLGA